MRAGKTVTSPVTAKTQLPTRTEADATPVANERKGPESQFDTQAVGAGERTRGGDILRLTREQIEALFKVQTPGPISSVPGVPEPPKVSGRLIIVNKGWSSANGEHFGPPNDSSIMLLSLRTGKVTTLPSAAGPHEIEMSPNGKWGAAPCYGRQTNLAPVEKGGGHEITLLDLEHEKTTVLTLPKDYFRPHGVKWLDDDRVVMTCEGKGNDISQGHLVVFNVRTQQLEREYPIGQAGTHLVRPSPDGKSFFATNMTGSVSVVNRESGEVKTLFTGPGAEGMELSPDQSKLWVLNFGVNPGTPLKEGRGSISIIDLKTLKIEREIPMPKAGHGGGCTCGGDACNPVRVVFAKEDGKDIAYITNRGSNDVSVLDVESGKEIHRTEMQIPNIKRDGTPDWGQSSVPVLPALHNTADLYYVATYPGLVVAVDRNTNGIAGFYRAGAKPDPLAFIPDPPEANREDWK